MKGFTVPIMLLAAVLVAGCQPRQATNEIDSTSGGAYRNISAEELRRMLKKKDFVLINVHIPFAGNIAGTDLSIPYDRIEQHLAQLPADKSRKIVLYCRSGHMSDLAAKVLIKLGYTNIWNLKGGMMDWEQAGFGLEK